MVKPVLGMTKIEKGRWLMMTEKLIYRTALRMLEKLVDTRYEYLDSPDVMKMTLGEIGGIIEMTNEMLEALENKNKNE